MGVNAFLHTYQSIRQCQWNLGATFPEEEFDIEQFTSSKGSFARIDLNTLAWSSNYRRGSWPRIAAAAMTISRLDKVWYVSEHHDPFDGCAQGFELTPFRIALFTREWNRNLPSHLDLLNSTNTIGEALETETK